MKKTMIAMAATLMTTSAFALTHAESEATVASAYVMAATHGAAKEVVTHATAEATVSTAYVMAATKGEPREVSLHAVEEAKVATAAQW